MNWIPLTLISTMIGSSNSILEKWLMNRAPIHPFVFVKSIGIVALPIAVVGLLILPLPPWHDACMGVVAGWLCIAGVWRYFDTIAQEDISQLEPLMRLISAQTLLFGAIFLGNTLTGRQVAACGALLASSLLLSFQPDKGSFAISRAALRVLPATTFLSANSILMAHIYRASSIWTGVVWEQVGIVTAVVFLGWKVAPRGCPVEGTINWRLWAVLIGEQVVMLITDLGPAYAVAHGVPIGLLSALNGVRPAWVWLFAVLILGERVRRETFLLKASGFLLMTMGIYWLL